jgi:putative ABC transport system permease protein
VAVGIALALVTLQLVRGQVFEVSPVDPATLVTVAVLSIAIAALACWLPAREASRIDPSVALRSGD